MTDRQLRILMRCYLRSRGYSSKDIIELIDEAFKEETPPSALERK